MNEEDVSIPDLHRQWCTHLDLCMECESLPESWCEEGTTILSLLVVRLQEAERMMH